MANSFVVAVDGGQSSTVCVLGTLDGEVLGAGFGGPCNHVDEPGGPGRMRRALTASIEGALAAVQPRPGQVRAAYLGLTGGCELAREIVPEIIGADRLLVEGDPPAALASGRYGGPGTVLIAGTGSVAMAQNAAGGRLYRGGWGYLVGDEGSGYWIGMRAIQSCARAIDGTGPTTTLCERIGAAFGIHDLREIAQRIYSGEIDRPAIAGLTPLVLQAAEAGDQVAAEIAVEAGYALAVLVEATCRAAMFTAAQEHVIVVAGGAIAPDIRNPSPVWKEFVDRTSHCLPGYHVIVPRFPPVIGAYFLALQLAGVRADTVVDRVEVSLAEFPHLLRKQRVATKG